MLIFSNPDNNPVKWRIDTNVIGIDHIFDFRPESGEVGPGDSSNIIVSFNPFEPGFFERSIPLFVDDPETKKNTSYIDIQLKGEGAFPKILFDRKDVKYILIYLCINLQGTLIFKQICCIHFLNFLYLK